MTVESRYKGGWRNVQDDCMLCEMEKKTNWHIETPNWVVADNLAGEPFVVYKEHKSYLTDQEWQRMEHIVGLLYDEFEVRVKMNMVSEHWHGHIIPEGERRDLTGE